MESFSKDIKTKDLTKGFIIIKRQCMRGFEHPKYIRDLGGVVINFKEVEHYTNQDKRYRDEIAEMWIIARKTLKALNN